MEIKPFCMKVNLEQSRIVQEFLFSKGYTWNGGEAIVQLTDKPYLMFGSYDKNKPVIMWSSYSSRDFLLITFEQFKNFYMKPTELKITPDKVLSAAKKCPQAKEVLKEMFPEVFEEDKYFDLSNTTIYSPQVGIAIRCSGEYAKKSFWLNDSWNWIIVKDSEDKLCLIPTKKS